MDPLSHLVFEEIKVQALELLNKDQIWSSGKYFGFSYLPDKKIQKQVRDISELFSDGNPINPYIFHSLIEMEKRIVMHVGSLLHAPSGFAGHLTSGGTESIFLAIKAAKSLFRENGNVDRMEIILADSTHPAFLKACKYMDIDIIKVPLDTSYRVDPASISSYITPKTGMIVASAPCYPTGVVDPIDAIGDICLEHNIPLHVDACIGGFILPYMEMINGNYIPFDFRTEGVTSISLDLHKYGYCPKGSSLIMYRESKMRARQYFVTNDWKGGIYGSVRLLGSTPGEVVAGVWATLQLLGEKGYLEMTKKVLAAKQEFTSFLKSSPSLEMISNPDTPVLTFRSTKVSSMTLQDLMQERGWYLERMHDPDSLHVILSNKNVENIDEFISDLSDIVTSAIPIDKKAKNSKRINGLKISDQPQEIVNSILRELHNNLYSIN